jgi:hypothetical protein
MMNCSPSGPFNKQASRLMNHKEMYKSPCRGSPSNEAINSADQQNGASPSWRDAYKKRCYDEFKNSRQKLLSKFRNLQVQHDFN